MADIAKAALGDRVLQNLGILAAGATAATADTTLVAERIDAVHERLRKLGLVPFATSAIPSWAQSQLCDITSADVAVFYGKSGQELMEFQQRAVMAERELARQVAGRRHHVHIQAKYY